MATTIKLLSSDETAGLLATILQAAGGTKAKWRKVIAIEPLAAWKYLRFNWCVTPLGTAKKREALDKAVTIVRAEHTYIAN